MPRPHVCHIVAMNDARAIGRDNQLPWHVPGDLKMFKAVTMGKPLIMGRKTHQSIGRPLPGRVNIVVTRDPDLVEGGVRIAHDLDEAMVMARDEAARAEVDEIMVIGGAEIFAQTLDMADRLYLTLVHAEVEGADTFYPDYDPDAWVETAHQDHPAEGGAPAFSVIVLECRRS